MEKFAGYGFNKSHSAAYALLSYQTAWLKAHYPAAFMSAVLSSDMDKTDKVVTLIDEARRMQLKVEPPDVNSSHYMFTVSGERSIRYGLGAIKGVGQSVVEMLVAEREAHGAFRDLADLCRRSDQNRMNRRVLEALIRSGALDLIGANRATLMHALPSAMQLADQTIRARVVGQNDMFGLMDHAGAAPAVTLSNEVLPDWSRRVRLDGERDTLGLYLTGHPFEEFEHEVRPIVSGRIADITGDRPPPSNEGFQQFRGKPATVAGMVFDLGKRGSRVIFTLDDRSGRLEASMFEDVWQQYRTLIAKSAILVVEGSLRFDEYIEGWRLTAKRVVRHRSCARTARAPPGAALAGECRRHFPQGARADAQAVPRRPLCSRRALPGFCSASRAGALGGMVGAADARAHRAPRAAVRQRWLAIDLHAIREPISIRRCRSTASSSSSPATSSSPPAS